MTSYQEIIKAKLISWIAIKLENLPTNPDAIAEHLRSLGFRGEQNSANFCPLACYFRSDLRASLDDLGLSKAAWSPLSPLVDEESVTIQLLGREKGGDLIMADVSLTENARDFVRGFDAGDYPELIEANEDD
jgi:hypothetical protein